MTPDELKALQAPLKAHYKEDPAAAKLVLKASGVLDPPALVCRVATFAGPAAAGLHPAAGGPEGSACSGDMVLEALAACAGVTLCAVATAMNIPIRGGSVAAEGDLDFRGTLGVSKEVPIGFSEIRLRFDLDSDATPEQIASLQKLTERYCVVAQSLKTPPQVTVNAHRKR